MSGTSGSINQIGDYRLIRKLGEGGMGAVFKARQISMDRDVALKVLPKHLARDPGFLERFYREARVSAKLDHPNIVRGIAVGEEQGFHYFAMEFIDGDNCEKLLNEQGKMRVADVVKITLDVSHALEHAHSKGMVHRDIKPDNIMVTRDGVVKLADLGLAKAIEEKKNLTQAGSGFGTPYYMPPEQARNAKDVDPRSDIYALGATVYHLLTGQVPFQGDTALAVLTAKEDSHHTPARRLNPEVPEVLDLIIDKMMACDVKARFQNAGELISSLEKTGLAHDTLSWLQRGASGPAARPAPARREAARGTPTQVAVSEPLTSTAVSQYFIRYKDRSGKLIKTSADKHQVRDLIRKGLLGTDAEGARDPNGQYRPLMAFPEFSDLVRSRVLKEKSDKAIGGMADKFAQFDQEEMRRRKMRKLKRLLARAAGVIVLIGLIVGAYFAWQHYQHQHAPAPPPGGQPTPAATATPPPS